MSVHKINKEGKIICSTTEARRRTPEWEYVTCPNCLRLRRSYSPMYDVNNMYEKNRYVVKEQKKNIIIKDRLGRILSKDDLLFKLNFFFNNQ